MIRFKKTILLTLLSMSFIVANAAQAVTGTPGPPGPQGKVGKTGATGAKGPRGDKGIQGVQGIQGKQGPKGAIGPKGDKGPAYAAQGPKGDVGAQGLQGPRGAPGNPTAGVDIGDMQYWDGTNWVMIPAPAFKSTTVNPPEMATLHFCSNSIAPTWKAVCEPSPQLPTPPHLYQIGETGPAGGKVFYITDGGLHGMEAAPIDQSSSAPWGCYGISIQGAQGVAVGTGKYNTAAINSKCGTGTAAQIAAGYSLNGFIDWYLPSKEELNVLYPSVFVNKFYWSSSEIDSVNAWEQALMNGFQQSRSKYDAISVRAIRDF